MFIKRHTDICNPYMYIRVIELNYSYLSIKKSNKVSSIPSLRPTTNIQGKLLYCTTFLM